MPDAIFSHPRLAAIYDTFDGDRGDLPHYVALVDELLGANPAPDRRISGAANAGAPEPETPDADAKRDNTPGIEASDARRVRDAGVVLDVGCGTGVLASLLAGSGRTVIGVDPAAASLDVAARRDHRVRWIHGDATALPALRVDVALMTGNVAQVFLTDDAWAATLRGIRAALRPGGHLVFETRRPGFRAWEEWAADTAPIVREVPGIGAVERHVGAVEVALPLVSFRHTYRFPDGAVLTSDSTLRFRDEPELRESLAAAGYAVRAIRQAPDRPDREYVVIAQATS